MTIQSDNHELRRAIEAGVAAPERDEHPEVDADRGRNGYMSERAIMRHRDDGDLRDGPGSC